ncbi:alpha/beta hydrolase [Sphingomonas panacisoli]|uniref:Alpha/beta hydrolase n=1 Tax=Sphingomonas panacisoli TaxID=1813879 RepID=A0A5B8LJV4_9SPHN|nr:alpha/beta hydrolase [Sphingomonas panacisoli]QDZ07822.1 alpha/beta hydrolase [Sphingomonas panacisoli]
MRRFVIASAITLAACHAAPKVDNKDALANETAAAKVQTPQPVELKAPDGVTVYGTYYPNAAPRALILLFHQAGSSSGEYADIAPRLQREGFAALAIDQRVGGNLYGANRTMAAAQDKTDYLGALPDLEAALAWAKAKDKPIVLWGSSYSASLVFLLGNAADAKGSVKAIMAFSPGEYFNDKKMVEAAAAKIAVPVFVTSANTLEEEGEAKAIVSATTSTDRQLYIPRTGIHGSSTLNATKNPAGADENWTAVLAFLKRVFP